MIEAADELSVALGFTVTFAVPGPRGVPLPSAKASD